MRAAGFVLTGGNSTRMGRDKALLLLDGGQLVHRIATTVSAAVDQVMLVGQPERYAHLPWMCLPDLRPGLGPLAGIETALTASTAELNVVVACDMPGLSEEWLRVLIDAAEATNAQCLVTQDLDGRTHPLCAVYRQSCLPYAVRALNHGQYRLLAFVEALGAHYLRADSGLDNVNTPLEWDRWRETTAGRLTARRQMGS